MSSLLSGDKPLYSQIMDILRDRIMSGEYKADQQLPTEVELAKQFNVSRITSKRALIELEREGWIYRRRGRGSFVKNQGESRNSAVGRQPAIPAGKIISMIIPYEAPNNMVGYFTGISAYLEQKGYYLSIHNSDWSSEQERKLLQSLPRRGTSGIILYPVSTERNLDVVYALYTNDFPIVTIDQYYGSLSMGSVVSDNFNGCYMAASKLIEMGHKRIAFLSTIDIQYRSTVRDRFFGYSKALHDKGILLDSDLIFSPTSMEAESSAAERQISYKNILARMLELEVTAVQAEHDIVAYDLIKAAVELGIKIPDQLSVVGFDNNQDYALHAEVPLTTIEQDCLEIGRRAAIMIVSQLESGIRQQERVNVPVTWIMRESAGPRPKANLGT